jgi:hypothetical protein
MLRIHFAWSAKIRFTPAIVTSPADKAVSSTATAVSSDPHLTTDRRQSAIETRQHSGCGSPSIQ